MMNFRIALAVAALAAAQGVAAQGATSPAPAGPTSSTLIPVDKSAREPLPPDTVLLENGSEKVTALDLDAAFTRFPPELREEARAYPSVILRNLDALYLNRVMADRARAAGLAEPAVVQQRMKQLQEAYLAQLYLDHQFDATKVPDLSARAEEIYKSDPKRFTEPESAGLQHIYVSLVARTPELALARAREAEQRLKSGEGFAAVAALYSDDPRVKDNQGNLGIIPLNGLEPELQKAVEPLKAGETTAPILTRSGVHIMRVTERRPARLKPFASVKDEIIAEEMQKYRKRQLDEMISAIRTDPKNTIYKDRVEAARSDIDVQKVLKSHSETIERIQAGAQ